MMVAQEWYPVPTARSVAWHLEEIISFLEPQASMPLGYHNPYKNGVFEIGEIEEDDENPEAGNYFQCGDLRIEWWVEGMREFKMPVVNQQITYRELAEIFRGCKQSIGFFRITAEREAAKRAEVDSQKDTLVLTKPGRNKIRETLRLKDPAIEELFRQVVNAKPELREAALQTKYGRRVLLGT